MEIIITKEPEELKLPKDTEEIVELAARTVGEIYGLDNAEVSITLTNNEYIHQLNKDYRQVDRPTDVLSFAFRDSDEPKFAPMEDEIEVLGDIIISVERAHEQALDFGHSFKREIAFLLVHGFLHLLGYDHMEEDEREEMEKEQRFVMDKLGISR